MQSIQIDGTYTYADNIKTLKIGEIIKLIPNQNNRLNSHAIGAYTINNKKIGYVPFKSNQIDINAKYIVTKINLTQQNPILLISRDFPNSNFIQCEPECISELKLKSIQFIDGTEEINTDLKKFTKFLQKSGFNINKIGICELTDSFITICIKTPESTQFFYTVSKLYYETNIFKYDEFYKFELMTKCIYQPFFIHRLEKYLELNYTPINKICRNKKLKLNIFEDINLNENCGMNKIQSDDLIIIEKTQINNIPNKYFLDWIKLLIKYNVQQNELYNPNNLFPNSNILINTEKFTNMYNNLEPISIGYNHKLKAYCHIDFIDVNNIVEICNIKEITPKYFIELIIKLIIADKQIINVYNPLDGILFQIEILDSIKTNIINLIAKK